ncbi:protein phosphatase 2C domain-containing protein [Candidatus Chloroploca asiatica]|uniref:PPM-type phosphatase domain-containing protein n=1 Tax=Candidatus Chloroploca asiatica TaxID=1506545 RepID=A0A2H3KQH9_9CHLR|nr:protein phosphatase 2C domain-containing protein [Candidatus Chloroploca asiatica]PDW00656.1 hypothetical protein A9Q02_21605 [Candidatus Chloroploca asiatica]
MLNGFIFGDRGLGASGDTHPLWSLGHALVEPYLVLGTSAVGQLHLGRGWPRDDAFMVRSLGPWVAVAVADGVGSRPLSRYGSTYAVEALSALLVRPFAVSLSEVRTSPRPGLTHPAATGLAPPAAIEDAELKWPLGDKGRDKGRGKGRGKRRGKGIDQLSGLFTKAPGSPPSVVDPPLRDDLQQGGSVGWWLPAGDLVASPDLAMLPTTPVAAQHSPGRPQPTPTSAPVSGTPAASQRATLPNTAATPVEPDLLGVINQAFEQTHLGLRDHAQRLGLELSDLGCTALALLFNRETGCCAVGQVGDGAMLGLRASGEVEELVAAPDPGDGQSVYTLNRPNFQRYLAAKVLQPSQANPFIALYVMTDGLSGDLLYSSQQDTLRNWATAVRGNLLQASSPVQAAAGMLNWLATYQVTGSWDDRTLVVITQRED